MNSSSLEGDELCDPEYTAFIKVFLSASRLVSYFYIEDLTAKAL
jgi:hypothetical protein